MTASREFSSSQFDSIFSEMWFEGLGVEDVKEIFSENRSVSLPALHKTRAPLKMILASPTPEMIRRASVTGALLNDGWTERLVGGSAARPDDCLVEVWMFKQFHVRGRSLLCQSCACRSPANMPKSKRESELRETRKRRKSEGLFRVLPDGADHGANARRFRAATFSRRWGSPSLEECSYVRGASPGDNSLVFPPCLNKSRKRLSVWGATTSLARACE